jgi:hypothetical protein
MTNLNVSEDSEDRDRVKGEAEASRSDGFHAIVRALHNYCSSDQMIYGAVSLYLDVLRFHQGMCGVPESASRRNSRFGK